MLRLYGLPACPQITCDVENCGVWRKELTEGIHSVAVPASYEPGNNVTHVLRIIRRRQDTVNQHKLPRRVIRQRLDQFSARCWMAAVMTV